MPDRPPRFAVLGPGGVGGFLAALLARSGQSVVVIASERTAGAIAQGGLRLESERFGDFQVRVEAATRLSRPVDFCLVTVKATQLGPAVPRVPRDQVVGGLVVPFLNGVDHVLPLRATYGEAGVAPATIGIEVARVETGLIRHTSAFASVDLAASDATRARVETLAAALRATGLDVAVRDDEVPMLWDKLAMLAPLALLTTHERATLGTVRSRRREEALTVINEVVAVARSAGSKVDDQAVNRLFEHAPASLGSSMQRDDAAGLPLELDAIGGAVLRQALRARIAVPATQRLVRDLATREDARASAQT